jgi:hypothetical protein
MLKFDRNNFFLIHLQFNLYNMNYPNLDKVNNFLVKGLNFILYKMSNINTKEIYYLNHNQL